MRVYIASSCMRACMHLGIPGRTIGSDVGRPRSERAHQSWMPVTAHMAAPLRRNLALAMRAACATPPARLSAGMRSRSTCFRSCFRIKLPTPVHQGTTMIVLESNSGASTCRHAEWTWRCAASHLHAHATCARLCAATCTRLCWCAPAFLLAAITFNITCCIALSCHK